MNINFNNSSSKKDIIESGSKTNCFNKLKNYCTLTSNITNTKSNILKFNINKLYKINSNKNIKFKLSNKYYNDENNSENDASYLDEKNYVKIVDFKTFINNNLTTKIPFNVLIKKYLYYKYKTLYSNKSLNTENKFLCSNKNNTNTSFNTFKQKNSELNNINFFINKSANITKENFKALYPTNKLSNQYYTSTLNKRILISTGKTSLDSCFSHVYNHFKQLNKNNDMSKNDLLSNKIIQFRSVDLNYFYCFIMRIIINYTLPTNIVELILHNIQLDNPKQEYKFLEDAKKFFDNKVKDNYVYIFNYNMFNSLDNNESRVKLVLKYLIIYLNEHNFNICNYSANYIYNTIIKYNEEVLISNEINFNVKILVLLYKYISKKIFFIDYNKLSELLNNIIQSKDIIRQNSLVVFDLFCYNHIMCNFNIDEYPERFNNYNFLNEEECYLFGNKFINNFDNLKNIDKNIIKNKNLEVNYNKIKENIKAYYDNKSKVKIKKNTTSDINRKESKNYKTMTLNKKLEHLLEKYQINKNSNTKKVLNKSKINNTANFDKDSSNYSCLLKELIYYLKYLLNLNVIIILYDFTYNYNIYVNNKNIHNNNFCEYNHSNNKYKTDNKYNIANCYSKSPKVKLNLNNECQDYKNNIYDDLYLIKSDKNSENINYKANYIRKYRKDIRLSFKNKIYYKQLFSEGLLYKNIKVDIGNFKKLNYSLNYNLDNRYANYYFNTIIIVPLTLNNNINLNKLFNHQNSVDKNIFDDNLTSLSNLLNISYVTEALSCFVALSLKDIKVKIGLDSNLDAFCSFDKNIDNYECSNKKVDLINKFDVDDTIRDNEIYNINNYYALNYFKTDYTTYELIEFKKEFLITNANIKLSNLKNTDNINLSNDYTFDELASSNCDDF